MPHPLRRCGTHFNAPTIAIACRTSGLAAIRKWPFQLTLSAQQLGYKDKNKPLPELASDGRWKLHTHSAASDLLRKRLFTAGRMETITTQQILPLWWLCMLHTHVAQPGRMPLCLCGYRQVVSPVSNQKLDLGCVLCLFWGNMNKRY